MAQSFEGTPEAQALRLIGFKVVRDRTGNKSKAWIYGQIKAGKFPRPRKAGASSLWLESEIDEWVRSLPILGGAS